MPKHRLMRLNKNTKNKLKKKVNHEDLSNWKNGLEEKFEEIRAEGMSVTKNAPKTMNSSFRLPYLSRTGFYVRVLKKRFLTSSELRNLVLEACQIPAKTDARTSISVLITNLI